MSANTIYLITGGNRGWPPLLPLSYCVPSLPLSPSLTQSEPGIGFGLTATLLLRPRTTVIATIRSEATAQDDLHALPVGENSRLIITYLDLSSYSPETETEMETKQAHLPLHTPQNLYRVLTSTHHITHLHTIIASAGHGTSFHALVSTSPSSLLQHFQINTLGPIRLFQALYPLLEGVESKFVLVSSSLGSIAAMDTQAGTEPTLAYGASKAAANYFCRKVHFECGGITALAVHPGWVKTGNGQAFADAVGVKEPPMSLNDSVKGVLKQVSFFFFIRSDGMEVEARFTFLQSVRWEAGDGWAGQG
ncbi:Norsolorinic acid ketoreductase [Lachnellula hyalina]|uniref:Norsolorinic acid ketoreductase n=1 Tax=Lachnellula hyalina TaxID=1316788 RepID=A0A8H8R7Y9_9HELO|nr:Norsolorinic acid ketoreductase [Lachnellula hyalina]TVY30210.1 Norsolorinic acid ketoreductase [Lachnellula hyalina]